MSHPITWFGRVVRIDNEENLVKIRVGDRFHSSWVCRIPRRRLGITAFVYLFMDAGQRPRIGEEIEVSSVDRFEISGRLILATPGKFS